ncbi:MAG: DNA polymerase/3'-5' exonuclease PolX [Candidatus Pacebacteria bacterium]|nr:DNA polymerase/3'-5' exonuclease PolX [Candidatus Paceibacterota bacterium]
MPVHNSEIASKLREIADLLEIQQANRFRIRAYHNAARTIETWTTNLRDMVDQGQDLEEIPGVGQDIAAKVLQMVQSGKITQLEELQEQLPSGLVELLGLEGLGPKRVQALYQDLGVSSQKELKQAALDHKIQELPGFGPVLEQKILKTIKNKSAKKQRVLKSDAQEVIEPLLAYLGQLKEVGQVAAAGSLRRKQETVGDVDLIATSTKGQETCRRFTEYEDVRRVISQGKTRSSVVLRTGLQVDLRVVSEDSFGSAMQYFTGSKAHNIKLRQRAIDQNCKLNEYGLFKVGGKSLSQKKKKEKKIAGASEKEIYQQLGLEYIEPELREGRGEIESAAENSLPNLIELKDVRGDLQLHTEASDGENTLEEMVQAARKLGYHYLAVTDHSQNLKIANGLTAKRYRNQFKEINRLNQKYDDFTIFKAAEVDILADGSLDLGEDFLSEFDLVLGSIHSHFKYDQAKQTKRVIKAMSNPYFNILAHPTGRLINQRQGYSLNLPQVIEAAKKYGCVIEINAQPTRLDLDDLGVKMAKEAGVKLSIGTDAHGVRELSFMQHAVDQARRGWLEANDVINTMGPQELLEYLQKIKEKTGD